MAIPTNKSELQLAITASYSKLRGEILTIPPELAELSELEGHVKSTMMSVNNLVAYLLGWGSLVLKWVEKKSKGEMVDFPETGYKWNELGLLAQKFYSDYQADSYETLCEKLDLVVSEILAIVENKSNEQLYGEAWYDKWPLGKMIQLNTSSPYSNALKRIRKWKKEKRVSTNHGPDIFKVL